MFKNNNKIKKILVGFFAMLGVLLFINFSLASGSEFNITINSAACGDGIDNDLDGKIDWPADPGCGSDMDPDESDEIVPIPPRRGGGGGGGGGFVQPTNLIFSGYSYNNLPVVILRDSFIFSTSETGEDGQFQIQISDTTPGEYLFVVYGQDKDGFRSPLVTIPLIVYSGTETIVSEIVISPTIFLNKIELKVNDNLAVSGTAVPNSSVTITASYLNNLSICDLDCNSLIYDMYIINPDGSERHTGSKYVRVSDLGEDVYQYNFEDSGVDFDYNDIVVVLDTKECSYLLVRGVERNASWKHQIKLKITKDNIVNDVLLWDDSTNSVNDTKSVDLMDYSGYCGNSVLPEPDKKEYVWQVLADNSGAYTYELSANVFGYGEFEVKSQSIIRNNLQSSYSHIKTFKISDRNILNNNIEFLIGDLSKDGRVNLVDFSILAYWYKKELAPNFIITEKERLNGDGKIDLTDFSIMAYNWTG